MINKEVSTYQFYKFEDYTLDLRQKLLFRGDRIIPLGQKPFECLLLMVKNANQVVLKEEFFEAIWENSFVEDGVLAVNISFLRKVFNEENKEHKFIETLPKRGYRFVASVLVEFNNLSNQLSEDLGEDFSFNPINHFEYIPSHTLSGIPSFEIDKTPSENSFNQDKRNYSQLDFLKTFYFRLIVLISLFGCSIFLIYKSYISTYYPTKLKKVSIVIFPFENISGSKDLDYLNLGLTDNLNHSLTTLVNTNVIPTSTIKKFVNQSYNPTEEGKQLGAEYIITGSFHTDNDKIYVTLRIANILGEKPIVQQQFFESPISNLTTLRAAVFKFLIISLNLIRPSSELFDIQQQETQNPVAYEYYLKGSDAFLHSNFDKAIMLLQKSAEADPKFLATLELLGTSYYHKGNLGGCGTICYDKGISYYEQLVQMAPDYHLAKLRLALVYVESNQIDKGIDLIKDVMSKNKNNKYAYFCLSYAYRYGGLLNESIELVKQSETVGGDDYNTTSIVTAYIYQQEYKRFLAELHFSSTNPYGLFYKGLANYYQGNLTDARNSFDDAYKFGPDINIAGIGKAYLIILISKMIML